MRKKIRIKIPDELAAQILVASDHTCCKCEERGKPVQIHHIDENPANNAPDNLAVLCFHCHDETQTKGGFGRRLSAADVRLYRNQWISRVTVRRKSADEIIIRRRTGKSSTADTSSAEEFTAVRLSEKEMEDYINTLPDILGEAYKNSRPAWDSGITLEVVRATTDVIQILEEAWLRLSSSFPPRHFGKSTHKEFLEEYIKQRYAWQRALAEPHGIGTGGTIAGPLTAKGVLQDMEIMVQNTVHAIRGLGQSVKERALWLERWEIAKMRHKSGVDVEKITKAS